MAINLIRKNTDALRAKFKRAVEPYLTSLLTLIRNAIVAAPHQLAAQ